MKAWHGFGLLVWIFTLGWDVHGQATTNSAPPPNAAAPAAGGPVSIPDFLARHISPYEPIFFIMGTAPAAEFQFSLKYEVFTLTNDWARQSLNDLYFAYTQTSFWNLLTNDPSFYDTSYKPSAFFYFTNVFGGDTNGLFRMDAQPGFEHESNGRGGPMERSFYTLYAQSTFTVGRPENWEFSLQPRAWVYTMVGHNNPDIAKYHGYADLIAVISHGETAKWGGMELMTTFHLGSEGSHPGLKFDFFFNLPKFLGFNPALQVEYFTGYEQTLIQYNTYSHGLRGGVCLWY